MHGEECQEFMMEDVPPPSFFGGEVRVYMLQVACEQDLDGESSQQSPLYRQ